MSEESEDLRKIAVAVFGQTIDDYIRLQLPSSRRKKYIHESYLEAVEMFWDPHYRLGSFLNEEGQPMSLEEFLLMATDRLNLDLEALYPFLIAKSKEYWSDKMNYEMKIPDVLVICEVPYHTEHTLDEGYTVSYEDRVISLDKYSSNEAFINFFTAILEIICFHQELRVSVAARKELGRYFYETLNRSEGFLPQA